MPRFSLRPSRLPLRTRLTLWYLLTLAAILLLFMGFLYWQVSRSMLRQLDAGLQLAATQALLSVAPDGERLELVDAGAGNALERQLGDDYVLYLLSPEGVVWDVLGYPNEFPPTPPRTGFVTATYEEDAWRVYAQAVSPSTGGPGGWLQVAQETDAVTDQLAALRTQMLLGLPLALLLAGLGGSFLASRALRPIEDITHTAQGITSAGDLSRRIGYSGPDDEVGRLATTFDGMLARLEAAFARERRFTGDAAHELRTPLTALKGRLEVTLSRARSSQEYVETLETMESQVDRLIRLSNDLLFMARLDQDRQTLRTEAITLETFLPAVTDQVAPLAAEKGIALSQDIPVGLHVTGDLDLLTRLFLNLLDNAVKYTPAGGDVELSARRSGEEIEISVSDSGPGIPAEDLPHLFERFYRADGDRARSAGQAGGAGLGLAIAREIARAHGGAIHVASEVGTGTRFTVTLPVAATPEPQL